MSAGPFFICSLRWCTTLPAMRVTPANVIAEVSAPHPAVAIRTGTHSFRAVHARNPHFFSCFMYSIDIKVMSHPEARAQFKEAFDFIWSFESPCEYRLDSMEFACQYPGESTDSRVEVLVARLPSRTHKEAVSLVSCELRHITWTTGDLQCQEAYAVLGPDTGGIHVPLRLATVTNLCKASPAFRIVLIGDDYTICARHELTKEHLHQYEVDRLKALCLSGGNYDPLCHHSYEQLSEARGRGLRFSLPGPVTRMMSPAV